MKFIAAICPQCAGSLQVPDDREIVKCMYCGVDVVVRQAVQLIPGNSKNLFELAESAFSGGNYSEAYGYYTKVLEIEPKNAAAWLGKGSSAGWLSTLNEFRFSEMLVAFETAVNCSADSSSKDAMKTVCALQLNAVATACYSISRKFMLEYVALPDSWADYLPRCAQIIRLMETAHLYNPKEAQIVENIIHLCKDNIEGVGYNDPYDNNIWKVKFLSDEYEREVRSILETYTRKLQILKPNFVPPNPKRPSAGCFVVTATMGNAQHPSVRILRVFRDESLSKFAVGRVFITWYLRYGPLLAMCIEKSVTARTLTYLLVVAPSVSMVRLLRFIDRTARKFLNRTAD